MVPSTVPSGLTTVYGVKLVLKNCLTVASSAAGSAAASAQTACHSAFALSVKQLRRNALKPSTVASSAQADTSLHSARRRLLCDESGDGTGGAPAGGSRGSAAPAMTGAGQFAVAAVGGEFFFGADAQPASTTRSAALSAMQREALQSRKLGDRVVLIGIRMRRRGLSSGGRV